MEMVRHLKRGVDPNQNEILKISVNVQNANNNANNENMATAGRRRTLKRLDKLKKFSQGEEYFSRPDTIRVGFKPIQIKHLERKKRKEENLETVAEEASLVALAYTDLFLSLETKSKTPGPVNMNCMQRMVCCTGKASASIGSLGLRLADVFAQTMISMLSSITNKDFTAAHETGLAGLPCHPFKCDTKKYSCE